MGLAGTRSHPAAWKRLERLARELAKGGGCEPEPRPRRVDRRRRPGSVGKLVLRVLREAEEPMRVVEIHAAAERLLGEPLAISSVKNCVAKGVRGDVPSVVRVARGRYILHPAA